MIKYTWNHEPSVSDIIKLYVKAITALVNNAARCIKYRLDFIVKPAVPRHSLWRRRVKNCVAISEYEIREI